MEINGVNEPVEARNYDKSSFIGVMLRNVRLEDVGLRSVRFDYVNMSGACLDNVDLAGGAIPNPNLAGGSFTDCNIAGFRVDGVLVCDALAAYRKSA